MLGGFEHATKILCTFEISLRAHIMEVILDVNGGLGAKVCQAVLGGDTCGSATAVAAQRKWHTFLRSVVLLRDSEHPTSALERCKKETLITSLFHIDVCAVPLH